MYGAGIQTRDLSYMNFLPNHLSRVSSNGGICYSKISFIGLVPGCVKEDCDAKEEDRDPLVVGVVDGRLLERGNKNTVGKYL